jgi:thymidylate synthase
MTATLAWISQLKKIVDDGKECKDTLELLSSSLNFNMKYPIVVNRSRKIGYKFMFAEARYIITGRSDVRLLEPHVPGFDRYSDLYPFQQGSYGPPFVEQVRYVVDTLKANDESRQAVMTIWRPNPRWSKDIPCTLSLQFLIRDDKLHTIVTMRSSDVFTGLIYDMFCFTAMSAVVLAYLDFSDVELGTCWINAGSSHLYKKDLPRLHDLATDELMDDGKYRFGDTYEEICAQLMRGEKDGRFA